MTDVAPHPAPFSGIIVEKFATILHEYYAAARTVSVLDPFAGVGGIHDVPRAPALCAADVHVQTFGIELEPRWAAAHERTQVGDALHLPFKANRFNAIMTSPCYGNRMADHHEAKDDSKRITYRHYYGEPLTEGSSAMMQWGWQYCKFHREAWHEALRVLRPGGIFVLNISNHIRAGLEIPVVEWHIQALLDMEMYVESVEKVWTPRMRNGANANLRVDGERIVVLRKDG